ncbi:MAG: AEC family transporter [Deltaproteobacteria bacterium]|nr:MAG: AEC family transporter [Deltaproteobacteria bacterium]
MIILDTILPLFVLLLLGWVLRLTQITTESFLKTADKLVYYIFFPAMLFWKIGNSTGSTGFSLGLCLAGIIAVVLVFSLGLVYIHKSQMPGFQAGSFSQACYRFNTYIGMAIVMNTLGEEGVRHFGILVGFVIPLINVLAVCVLIWHSDQNMNMKEKLVFFARALISNPLILGCVAGLLISKSGFVFPRAMNNTFGLMTAITLPLALISIGGTLSFRGLACHTRAALTAACFKLLVLPVAGFILLKIFFVTGIPFKTGMIFFCLPTSTAIYVLSAQLNSDTELASAAIMLSTLFSFVSLSVALLL